MDTVTLTVKTTWNILTIYNSYNKNKENERILLTTNPLLLPSESHSNYYNNILLHTD